MDVAPDGAAAAAPAVTPTVVLIATVNPDSDELSESEQVQMRAIMHGVMCPEFTDSASNPRIVTSPHAADVYLALVMADALQARATIDYRLRARHPKHRTKHYAAWTQFPPATYHLVDCPTEGAEWVAEMEVATKTMVRARHLRADLFTHPGVSIVCMPPCIASDMLSVSMCVPIRRGSLSVLRRLEDGRLEVETLNHMRCINHAEYHTDALDA